MSHFLDSLRSAPKDITPREQITEAANRRIREQRARDADPFAKKFKAPAEREWQCSCVGTFGSNSECGCCGGAGTCLSKRCAEICR